MKIVFISPWFSENMGYSENLFPKAIAKHGHEVHLITSNAQVYFNSPDYKKIYEPFLGPSTVECTTKEICGFMLHRLPYYELKGRIRNKISISGIGIRNLNTALLNIKPDIIQTFNIAEIPTLECARYSRKHNVIFFTESHMHASVFRKNNKKTFTEKLSALLNKINPAIRLIINQMEICYPIAQDIAEIVETFYSIPKKKIKIQSLGIDTELFTPVQTSEQENERNKIRSSFGFTNTDLVCIYTGRFTKDKDPFCLADAVAYINEKRSDVKALFLGSGTEKDIEYIKSKKGCYIHPFVKVTLLPSYYRAADLGVWPKQESTSQLDAAACGLPLILSNKIEVHERVSGNGLLYEEGEFIDMAGKIMELFDKSTRKKMSIIGIDKVIKSFSWEAISREREKDYYNALGLGNSEFSLRLNNS